jgi:hypothetical protein
MSFTIRNTTVLDLAFPPGYDESYRSLERIRQSRRQPIRPRMLFLLTLYEGTIRERQSLPSLPEKAWEFPSAPV